VRAVTRAFIPGASRLRRAGARPDSGSRRPDPGGQTVAARAVLVLLAAILTASSVAHLWTGLADQGDYARSTGFLLDRPAAFAQEVRAARATDRRDRFLSAWHDRWVLRDAPDWGSLFNASSYKLVLAGQVAFDAALTGDRVHSLRVGSVPARLVLLASVLGLAALALRSGSLAAALPFVLLLGATALESSFVAFLNSAYEEQVAIVALPLLALVVWRGSLGQARVGGAIGVAVAAIVGGSKAQFFAIPLLVVPFLWPTLRARFGPRRALGLVVAGQLAAAAPLVFNPASGVNAYHASYYGILRAMAPASLAAARIGGAPVLAECVGVKAFGPRGEDCLRRAAVGFGDVARLAVTHPRALAAAFGGIVVAGTDLELAYLGKAMPHAPTLAELPPFAGWRALFRLAGLAVFPAVILATTLLLRASRAAPLAGATRAGAFLGLVAITQYLVALGDGLVEVPKHVLVGNYASALCLSFGAFSLAWAFAGRRAERRGGAAAPGLSRASDAEPG
jgi:hypothetical protein